MAHGYKTGGRRKGTPNRVTCEVREMVTEALEQAGGVAYLARQAEENPRAFLTLVGKLMPPAVSVKDEGLTLEDILAASWDESRSP